MKKFISLLLAMSILLLMVGCGASESEEKALETVTEAEADAPEADVEETDDPEADAEETDAPEADAEETDAPVTDEVETDVSDIAFPLTLTYSSGAGAWYADLILKDNGTFEGNYSDFDAGKYYTSNYSGEYSLEKAKDYSYTLTFGEFSYLDEVGSTWNIDGDDYEACEAVGFENCEEFILYTPNTPVSELSEDFLIWYQREAPVDTLGCYALCNPVTGTGYFAY